MEEVQKYPETDVQLVMPQKHGASFLILPSVCVQTGTEKQRQYLELVEHELVEEESVLNQRSLSLSMKHPGG